MLAVPLLMICKDALTGSDDFGDVIDSIIDGLRIKPTQADFALCAP